MSRGRATVKRMENPSPESWLRVCCPHCGQPVGCPRADQPQAVDCPQCGGSMWISPPAAEEDRPAELDGMRIRQLTAGRRAAMRFHTYLLVGLIGCLVAAIQALILVLWAARRGNGMQLILWIALLILFLIMAAWLLGRLRQWSGQQDQAPPPPPPAPPDFGPLSDGSQHWKNLGG